MLQGVKTKMCRRAYKVSVAVLALAGLVGMMLYTGFATDVALGLLYRLPSGGSGAHPGYWGPTSLEERILSSDVIARVRLISMSLSIEELHFRTQDDSGEWIEDTYYGRSLEFRFEVLEYLKGEGAGEVVGVVGGGESSVFKTNLGAHLMGSDITAMHDSTWDEHEAIVFLSRNPILSDTQDAERYFLGENYGTSMGGSSEGYSVNSPYHKAWLPAADSTQMGLSGAASSATQSAGEQRFLTGAERTAEESFENFADYQVANSAYNRALGTGGDASTITVSQLNALIVELQAEVAAGDGSEAYSECVYEKYKWEREFTYNLYSKDSANRLHRTNHSIASGLPAETAFGYSRRTDPHPDLLIIDPDFVPTWEAWLEGDDANIFKLKQMAIITTARPLPRGNYRYYFNERGSELALCDAYPDARRTWNLHTVVVYAPQEVSHEAFFDLVAIDAVVGADGENGVLRPDRFETDDGETVIESIVWRDGQVQMELSPAADLSDYRIDFIALDGSVALRLDVIDAIEVLDEDEVATLIWGVCEQPWVDGDLLMLRIAGGTPGDGVQATNDAECLAAAQEQVTADAAEPTATLEPTPTPEPTAEPTRELEPTATPEVEPTSTPEPTATHTPTATVETEPTPTPTPTATATSEPPQNLGTPTPTAAPPAPQNLTAVLNEDGSVTLSWDAPDADSITGYQILRQRPTEGEDALLVYVEDTGSTDTSYTDTEVTPGIQHIYRVKAINDAGLSDVSNFVGVDP